MDTLEWLRTFGDDEVDLYITSPPWDYRGGGKSALCTTYDLISDAGMVAYMAELYRTLKPDGTFYCFISKMRQLVYARIIEGVGFHYRTVCFWDKCQLGLGKWGGQVEPIYVWHKGPSPRPLNMRTPDLMSYRSPGQNVIPWQVYHTVLKMSAHANAIVCDPFAGSNPLRVAARMFGQPLEVRSNDINWDSPQVVKMNAAYLFEE